MEVKGKIIVALPEVSGTSQTGKAWKKQEGLQSRSEDRCSS